MRQDKDLRSIEKIRYQNCEYFKLLNLAREKCHDESPVWITETILCSKNELSVIDEINYHVEPFISLGGNYFAREHAMDGFSSIYSVDERVRFIFSIHPPRKS